MNVLLDLIIMHRCIFYVLSKKLYARAYLMQPCVIKIKTKVKATTTFPLAACQNNMLAYCTFSGTYYITGTYTSKVGPAGR